MGSGKTSNHSLILTGTTCATILARSIYTEGCKSVAAGMNALDLRKGISMAVDSVVTYLKSRARMISTSEEIAQVLLTYSLKHLGFFSSESFGYILGLISDKGACIFVELTSDVHGL